MSENDGARTAGSGDAGSTDSGPLTGDSHPAPGAGGRKPQIGDSRPAPDAEGRKPQLGDSRPAPDAGSTGGDPGGQPGGGGLHRLTLPDAPEPFDNTLPLAPFTPEPVRIHYTGNERDNDQTQMRYRGKRAFCRQQ